ncbi:CHAT domain-containing protein [Paucibacter sp. PLA-PC-4]|uniref:CHAT domain-containing tetratricopeptide repeat protein n=1 Tax=Paucibacter sp. PLA-PC-4 TaxID=2993655 RepID=UPI00224A59F2|nr:CHAT domain-containing protein [Paucibacter sp. PLA-PC-4]MCX2864917.1 CHAT domain-containing protein [Paucibacter sp. PLA-PC-4]
MSTSIWKKTRKNVLLLTGVLTAVAASAALADEAAILEKACAAVPPIQQGTWVDLDVLNQRIIDAQTAQSGTGIGEACLGWRQVMRDHPDDVLLRADWQAKIASALVWSGRSADAEPLLTAAYGRYVAAGPVHSGKSGMIAGMLVVIWLQRSQLETALQWSQRAIDSASSPASGLSTGDRLRLRLNHGALLSSARRFDEANTLLLGLLDESLSDPDTLAAHAAGALNSLANLARRQSRLEQALGYTEREISLRQERLTNDPVNIAIALQNRGLLLMSLARFDAAELALQAALQQARQAQASGAVDMMGHQASVRETLSGLLLARGRPAEALQLAQDAVASVAGRPESKTARGARPLRRLAEAQMALGDLGQGIASYRRALALLATTVGAPEADTAYALRLGYALAMIELGELGEAAANLQLVMADARPRSPEEQARTQVLQATLAQRRGDGATAALAWLAADQALAGALPPEHPSRRLIQAQACELAAAACPAEDAAAAAAGQPDIDALMQMSLARRARVAGDGIGADAAARRSVSAALASGQPRLQWQALALWADIKADAGQREQAIFLGKLALGQLQQQRQRLLPMGTVADARYLADKAPLYRRVADWLLQAQRLPEALEVMRLLKAHEQADFNERGFSEAFTGDGVSLNPAEQAAWQRFEATLQSDNKARAAELRALSDRAAAQRITAEEAARLAQLRRDDALQQGSRLAGLNELLIGLQAPARKLGRGSTVQRPPAGQLYVYTLAGEQRLSLLLVGATGTQLHQLDLPASELAQQVAALRDALADTGPVRLLSEALYGRLGHLIAQSAHRNQAEQIVVWLDGPLRYLPLGVMHDGKQHLATRYRWVVAGGQAQTSAVPRHSGTSQIAAFGVTQALQGLPALPAVADELCDIVDGPVLGLDAGNISRCGKDARGNGPVPGQGRLNSLFTEDALTRAGAMSGSGNLLHIGTHFVLRPGSIAKSWLLLGDGTRLPLERMRGMRWGTPQLVTLSACETAVADVSGADGREVDGLAAALLDNGAAQVLASLWRVDDRATARFMQRFYAAYAARASQDGNAAATALRQAQRQAMADGAPARDWAAFVLLAKVGEGSRTPGTAPLTARPR